MVGLATGTSDRSISPGGMTEEERRELIARQHRALYGNESNLYTDQPTTHQSSQDARVSTASIPPPTGARNTSPLAFDPFGLPSQSSNAAEAGATAQASNREQPQAKEANAGPNQSRSRANSTSPPSSNPTTSFALFENAQQSSRTSASSPGGSPPRQNGKGSTSGSVAPIGTRPSHTQSQPASGPLNPGLSRRSTTPLPSPLSFGFTAEQQAKISGNGGSGGPAASGSGQQQSSSGNSNGNNNAHKNHTSSSNGSGNGGGKSEDANGASNEERSASTGSNPSSGTADKNVALGWGSNSGVWGTSKNSLGVQASVWG